ncbi:hypothetical protein CUMW_154390 [Citrus unshiu]|nr:hypothetical protein CUMW_154390 [Citrus unshiu]
MKRCVYVVLEPHVAAVVPIIYRSSWRRVVGICSPVAGGPNAGEIRCDSGISCEAMRTRRQRLRLNLYEKISVLGFKRWNLVDIDFWHRAEAEQMFVLDNQELLLDLP